MSRILLADDSPNAQRMGEQILRTEGYEVVTVTDGETALIRLSDVDPDLVLADAFLPQRSGYEICHYVKNHPRHRHARVLLTAGFLEPVDEVEAARVRADGILRKPFEASTVISVIRPLVEAAQAFRSLAEEQEGAGKAGVEEAAGSDSDSELAPAPEGASGGIATEEPAAASAPATQGAAGAAMAAKVPAPIDVERVRAAVTIALDRAMPAMIDEITERVLIALGQ